MACPNAPKCTRVYTLAIQLFGCAIGLVGEGWVSASSAPAGGFHSSSFLARSSALIAAAAFASAPARLFAVSG